MKKILMASALVAAMAMPGMADEACGPMPYPPAFPSVSELNAKPVDDARKDLYAAFHQIKIYQTSLKSYRDCLVQMTKKDKQDIADAQAKPDEHTEAKVDAANKRIATRQTEYDNTVDAEQKMAKDFNTLHVAHCQRDTNEKVCPKPKQ